MNANSLRATIDLASELKQLRDRTDCCRAELFWSMERLRRSRRRSAALIEHCHQRRCVQIYRPPAAE